MIYPQIKKAVSGIELTSKMSCGHIVQQIACSEMSDSALRRGISKKHLAQIVEFLAAAYKKPERH
jgi:DNA-binding FrmR family transcriptional regulator